jgi:hypothetical protein
MENTQPTDLETSKGPEEIQQESPQSFETLTGTEEGPTHGKPPSSVADAIGWIHLSGETSEGVWSELRRADIIPFLEAGVLR